MIKPFTNGDGWPKQVAGGRIAPHAPSPGWHTFHLFSLFWVSCYLCLYCCCYYRIYFYHYYCCQVANIPEPRAQQRAARLARPKPQPKPKLTALKAPRLVRQAPAVPSTSAPPVMAAQATGTARVLPRNARLHHHLKGWVAVTCQHVLLQHATWVISWGCRDMIATSA